MSYLFNNYTPYATSCCSFWCMQVSFGVSGNIWCLGQYKMFCWVFCGIYRDCLWSTRWQLLQQLAWLFHCKTKQDSFFYSLENILRRTLQTSESLNHRIQVNMVFPVQHHKTLYLVNATTCCSCSHNQFNLLVFWCAKTKIEIWKSWVFLIVPED